MEVSDYGMGSGMFGDKSEFKCALERLRTDKSPIIAEKTRMVEMKYEGK